MYETVENTFHGSPGDPCVYCGDMATDWEHVIPKSYGIPTLVVRACGECNGLAGSEVFNHVLDKYEYIQGRLRRRHRKLLRRGRPTAEDMEDMSDNLRNVIRLANGMSDVVAKRVSYPLHPEVSKAYERHMLNVCRKLTDAD